MNFRNPRARVRLRRRARRLSGLGRHHRHHPPRQRKPGAKGALGQDRRGLQRRAQGRQGRVQVSRERGVQGQAADDAAVRRSRPDLFYSWAGGVMQAQDKAGFLKDITADVADVETEPVADRGRRLQGRRQSRRRAVRGGRGRLLLQQEAVREGRREGRGHQELGRFSRRGQEAQGRRASRRSSSAPARNGRCTSTIPISSCASAASTRWPTPRRARTAASRTRPSSRPASACANSRALEPFQPGYLSTSHAQSAGMFGDGKAAMDLMGQWLLGMQAPNSASGKGLPEEDIGILSVPDRAGRQGQGDRYARRHQRLAGDQDRAARRRSIS